VRSARGYPVAGVGIASLTFAEVVGLLTYPAASGAGVVGSCRPVTAGRIARTALACASRWSPTCASRGASVRTGPRIRPCRTGGWVAR